MKRLTLALALFASPATAGVGEALDQHILPGFHRFAETTAALDAAAQADCLPAAVTPAFHDAFDAWMAVGDLRLGPSETGALSIAFWPDARGFIPRGLTQMIAAEDPAVTDPAVFAQGSIATRGLFALEMMLFDPAFADYAQGSYSCQLVRALGHDLAAQGAALDAAWSGEFADALRHPGAAGGPYLDDKEALRALFTQLLASLDFTADQRLGRPMGTFDAPRPTRAEAWRSGRSLRDVLLVIEAAQALAHGLADGPLPQTDAAAERIREFATLVVDPGFQDVADPSARFRLEVLQRAVDVMQEAIAEEIGTPLGISAGFNAQDGD